MFVDILHYFQSGIDWFLIFLVSNIGCAVVVKDQVFGCDWMWCEVSHVVWCFSIFLWLLTCVNHHRILAALVYYFRLCHLSEYLIQRVIISCMYLIYIRYSCIVLYVIFSWKQDQVLGETFHLFKFFGCEQQPAPSACGCGRPVRRDVTGQCPLERRSFVVLDCSYNENGSSTNLPGTTNANLGSKVGASVAGRNVQKNKEQEQSYNNETQNNWYHFKFT